MREQSAMAKEEKPKPPERNKKEAINFIIYVLCIASLGAAVYTNVRLRSHDERIKSLESLIYAGGSAVSGESFNNYKDNVKVQPAEDLLQRLQHQVAGIQQRLRRDVSQLELIRSPRQVPDCICPAGE